MSCSLSVPLCSIATCVSQPSIALSAAPLRQRRCSDAPAFVASEQQTASRQASNRALQARHMPRDCPRTPIRPATPSPSTSVWQCPLAMPLTTAPLTIICAPPRHMASASHVSRPSAHGRRPSAPLRPAQVCRPALARPVLAAANPRTRPCSLHLLCARIGRWWPLPVAHSIADAIDIVVQHVDAAAAGL